jgi:predicted AlkP superfamily pyrophosphatase or phosphodiesterase
MKWYMGIIEEYPLTGHGMSETAFDLKSSDLGFINTLVNFGIIGQICILFIIFSVLIKGYRIYTRMNIIKEKSYVLGALGIWCAMIVGYGFSMDFFTTGTSMVCFCMALIDRANVFNKRGLLQVQGSVCFQADK